MICDAIFQENLVEVLGSHSPGLVRQTLIMLITINNSTDAQKGHFSNNEEVNGAC